MPSLTFRYDIFLSHSKHDLEWVWNLVKRLEKFSCQGRRLKVFFSPRDIRPGETITEAMRRGISKSRFVGVVMSPEALQSPFVQTELGLAFDLILRRKRRKDGLIPILLRRCRSVPLELNIINRINFTDAANFEVGLERLVAVIKGTPLHLDLRRQRPSSNKAKPSSPVAGRRRGFSCTDLDLLKFIPAEPPFFLPRYNKKKIEVLKLVKAQLARRKRQLVALWGPGGMGKTTMAVMAARQMHDDFKACVLWINAYEDPEFSLSKMLDLIAARLGRQDLRAYSFEQKKAKVSELVKRIAPLVILDNYEKLKHKEQEECKKWLNDHAACPALLTTRKKVRLALNIPVGKISLDDGRKFLDFLRREEDNDE